MKIGIIVPSPYMSEKRERVFALKDLAIDLADGLVRKGHEVWLFGTEDMETKAHAVGGDKVLEDQNLTWWKLRNEVGPEKRIREKQELYTMHKFDLICKAIEFGNKHNFDVMHYFYETDPTHFMQRFAKYPFVFTLHDPMPTVETIEYWYHQKYKNDYYVGISKRQIELSVSGIKFIDVVYNGIDLSEFEYRENPKADYMSYMNRFIPEKNVQDAIRLSNRTKFTLKIGGLGRNESLGKKEFFDKHVRPYINGKNIQVVDFLHGKRKSDFLGRAKFDIFPILWEEPFGLVMTESMACGTPVIAFGRGSINEIVENGKTGYVVDPAKGYRGLLEAYELISNLSEREYIQMRRNCRKRVEKLFTVDKMVDGYENAYFKVIKKYKNAKK